MNKFTLVAIGMAVSLLIGTGVFNESGDAKLASSGWCTGLCK